MPRFNLPAKIGQEDFAADENQNDRQCLLEINETADGGFKQEIQRPQSENGKNVAGVNDEDILRNQKDGGNAVEGENYVHGFNNQQGEKQRGDVMAPVLLKEKVFAVNFMRDVKKSGNRLVKSGFFQRHLFFRARQHHFDTGVEEESGENIKHPMEFFNQRIADKN